MKIMKINILNQVILKIVVFLTCGILAISAVAQEKKVLRQYEVTVTDEENAPLSGVRITVGQGASHEMTDKSGIAVLKAAAGDLVTFQLKGFDTLRLVAGKLSGNEVISLTKSKLLQGGEEIVPLPFTLANQRNLTGSSGHLSGRQLETYPTTDIRNSFSGLVTGLEVLERNGAPGLTAEETIGAYGITQKVSLYSRGTSPVFIIDDLQVDATEMPVDPLEIETITLVKDIVGKSMYGPEGANGIVYIKTKHGRQNERILDVNAEYGVSVTDRFPEWVSGEEYARLNNLARENSNMAPLYSPDDISAYAKNDPYDLYHPNINFREMMLKNNRAFRRMNLSAAGGSD